jgi:hypothetical protein
MSDVLIQFTDDQLVAMTETDRHTVARLYAAAAGCRCSSVLRATSRSRISAKCDREDISSS